MIAKRKPAPEDGGEGSKIAIVFNGSPLFTGDAGSGESNTRRWVIENDWLDAIIALPDQLFYNTGISTYIWIVSNRKAKHRRGRHFYIYEPPRPLNEVENDIRGLEHELIKMIGEVAT